ncbi:hypothetical protein ACIRQP_41475 [Streptomyces sp. NPDC102274]|uniref:hypothetical protein n=1 Tax=Streptomyces sp. NPDC102274 TaxID=3366151 RepID=UPI0038023CA2
MKRNVPAHATCVEGPSGAGSQVLPAPAVVVVVVVLLITAGLLAFGMTIETVVTTVVAGGLTGKALVRSLVTVFSPHRV